MASESGLPPNLFNCASGICCQEAAARAANVKILRELGCPYDHAEAMAAKMAALGVAFAPVSLMDEISKLADHPGRKA